MSPLPDLFVLSLLTHLVQAVPAPQPRIEYVVAIDSTSATSFRVEMRVRGGPDTLHLAMAAHPEYDDRFWRYVRDLSAESAGGAAQVIRVNSARWDVVAPSRDVIVRYRIEPPPEENRGSWRAYVSPRGALTGGPHTFMYLVGHESSPSRVVLRLPPGWGIATGLKRMSDVTFAATDVQDLLDSPILVGALKRWTVPVSGVPHEIVYAPSPEAPLPDTVELVRGLGRLARATRNVFAGFPYDRFVFLLQADASGGLEHHNSTTLGASDEYMKDDARELFSDAAHEFFHTWNEVALRPSGWGGVTYRPPGHTREMWWMEGVTMHYADVLLRRAGLPTSYATRVEQLERDIAQYLDNPSNALVSPEEAGWWSGDPPGTHGDLLPDYYMQGKLVAAMLDLHLRDSTDGRRTLDDAMRKLYNARRGRGYTRADIRRAIDQSCACALTSLVDGMVARAGAIDFDSGLRAVGLRAVVTTSPETTSTGAPRPDLRVWAYEAPGERGPRLQITQPNGIWARVGLHSGDRILSWNDTSITGRRDFLTRLRALKLGDSVSVAVDRRGEQQHVSLRVPGFSVHHVRLMDLPQVSARQRRLRRDAMLDGRR